MKKMITLTDIFKAEENLFVTNKEMNKIFSNLPNFGIGDHKFPISTPLIYAIGGKQIKRVEDGYVLLIRCRYCGVKDAGLDKRGCCARCGAPII